MSFGVGSTQPYGTEGGEFDRLGGPFGLPNPNAIRNAKREQRRKDQQKVGQTVMGTVLPKSPLAQPPQQNSTMDAVPKPTPIPTEQVPQFQPAQYEAPKKGLEYLALGIGLLFPNAPIARIAAGFAGGLQQGAEQSYQRREQAAEQQYKGQIAQSQADYQQKLATAQATDAYNKNVYEAAQALRQQGIDPVTKRPFVLPPALSAPLPPNAGYDQWFVRENGLAQFYAQVGATDQATRHAQAATEYKGLAIDEANNARALKIATQNEQASWNRLMITEHHQDILHADTEAQTQRRFDTAQTNDFIRQAITEAHQDAKATRTDPNKQQALRDSAMKAGQEYYALLHKATAQKQVTDPLGQPMMGPDGKTPLLGPAELSGPMFQAVQSASNQISRSKNPLATAQAIVDGANSLTPVQKEIIMAKGRYADLTRRSQGVAVYPHPGESGTDTAKSKNTALPPTQQHNGKTYYLHPDGNYYLAPPSGGGPQAAVPFASPTP